MDILSGITFAGGLALFLYGMRIMGDALKRCSSGALQHAIEKVTNNNFKSFLLGLFFTAVIQSSTATIVITSGLVGAGIISLHQSLGIILGANVGTTATGQIIRILDVSANGGFSLLSLIQPFCLASITATVGILLIMACKSKSTNTAGEILLGFAILFMGLVNISNSVAGLSESPTFAAYFTGITKYPILGFLSGLVVCAIIQSSSATVGILQALSVTGCLTFVAIYPLLLGIFMGDCIKTAFFCGVNAQADAKRTGLIHVIFNVFQMVLIIVVVAIAKKLGLLDNLWNARMNSGAIADVNTILKLGGAIILLPCCNYFVRLSRKFIKDDPETMFLNKILNRLDRKLFVSPTLALANVNRVLTEMSASLNDCFDKSMNALITRKIDPETVKFLSAVENNVDAVTDNLQIYLMKLSSRTHTSSEMKLINYYENCAAEFERAFDAIHEISKYAAEMQERNVAFTQQATRELILLREAVANIICITQNAFLEKTFEAARYIEPLEQVIDAMTETVDQHHMQRTTNGICSNVAGFFFFNVLRQLEILSDKCSNIGIHTISYTDSSIARSHHEYLRKLHKFGDKVFDEEYKKHYEHFMPLLEDTFLEATDEPKNQQKLFETKQD